MFPGAKEPKALAVIAALFIAAIMGATALAGGFHQTVKAMPKLSFIGLTYPRDSSHGQAICNEDVGSHKTFRFQLTGFTPNGQAMIIVRYPNGQFYWYHNSYGIVRADGSGSYLTNSWACWKGPNGSMDPVGKYFVTVIDFTSNRTSNAATFLVDHP